MKINKFEKTNNILKVSDVAKWCYVNINNEFNFMDEVFKIDESVKEYRVYNRAGEVEDYTNESLMDKIFVTVNKSKQITFFNQDMEEIDRDLIRVIS